MRSDVLTTKKSEVGSGSNIVSSNPPKYSKSLKRTNRVLESDSDGIIPTLSLPALTQGCFSDRRQQHPHQTG